MSRGCVPRDCGRAHVVLAALVALVTCAAIAYVLTRDPGDPGAGEKPSDETSLPVPEDEPGAGAATDVAPPPGEAKEAKLVRGGPDDAAAPDEEPAPEASPPGLRITGTVMDEEERPLEGAVVRWIPAAKKEVESLSREASLFSAEVQGSPLPPGPLGEALARSIATSTLEDGSYEIRIEPREGESAGREESAIIAWLPGRERALEKVEPVSAKGDGAEAAGASQTPSRAVSRRIDLELGPGGSISGTVTVRGSGEPATGMTVTAGELDPDQPLFLAKLRAESSGAVVGPEGAYAIVGLAPGTYHVLPVPEESGLVAPPETRKRVVVEPGGEVLDVDFLVDEGGTIAGRVLGPGGEPVGDAKCQVLPEDYMSAALSGELHRVAALGRSLSTDAEGRFEFASLSLGKSYQVVARADDFASSVSEAVELTEEHPDAEIEVSLRQGRTISGRVIDEDGMPAPGVEVHVVPSFGDTASLAGGKNLETEADADGLFTLRGVGDGEYRLAAGEIDPLTLFVAGGSDRLKTVKVSGYDVTGVVLVTSPASGSEGLIAGAVVDDLGRPIEGASVEISSKASFPGVGSGARAETDARGAFSVAAKGDGPFRLEARAEGHKSATLEVAPEAVGVQVVLERHGRVSGRVAVSGGGVPAVGGKVSVVPAKLQSTMERLAAGFGKGAGPPEADIAPDGSFTLDAPAGEVRVVAHVPGSAPGRAGPVRVWPGEERRGVEVSISQGATLLGRVTAAGRAALEGARVTVRRAEGESIDEKLAALMPQLFGTGRTTASSDEEGDFELPFLEPGEYLVRASHEEYAPSDPVQVTLVEDQVKRLPLITLLPGATLTLEVTEGDAPKPSVMVQVMSERGLRQAATDPHGRARVTGLSPGECQVTVNDMSAMTQGKFRLKTRSVNLVSGENAVRIVFGTGHSIAGKVEGLPPAPQRMVLLRRPGGPAPESVDPGDIKAGLAAQKYQAGMAFITTDDTYEIGDVEAGKYIIEIPRLPDDPTDLEAYKTMDRTPWLRREIEVKDRDVELDLEVEAGRGGG